jgi:membrane complex biogenesis BtpA family protein
MRMSTPFRELWPAAKPLIGMIHLLPLPGSPGWGGSMDALLERALADAGALEKAGLDGLLVENYLDVPFFPDRVPPETVAAMAVCVREVVRSVKVPVGVNVLRNDALAAMAVAAAAGARFVRVNVHTGVMAADQGLLTGRAHETMRLRTALKAEAAVFADVWVKHAVPLPGAELAQAAEDAFRRGLADALIVTGAGTGKAADLDRLAVVKAAVPGAPVLVGSGVTPETVRHVLAAANGAIVGSALSRDGRAGSGIDAARAAALVRAARGS